MVVAYRWTHSPHWLAWSEGWQPLSIHWSYEPSELSHHDVTINIIVRIIITRSSLVLRGMSVKDSWWWWWWWWGRLWRLTQWRHQRHRSVSLSPAAVGHWCCQPAVRRRRHCGWTSYSRPSGQRGIEEMASRRSYSTRPSSPTVRIRLCYIVMQYVQFSSIYSVVLRRKLKWKASLKRWVLSPAWNWLRLMDGSEGEAAVSSRQMELR